MKQKKIPSSPRFLTQKSDKLAIPLAIFVLLCLYFHMQNPPLVSLDDFDLSLVIFGTFSISPLVMLLTFIFGYVYIYKTLKRIRIHPAAQVVGWIFVGSAVLSALYIWAGGDRGCTGFMGAQTTCAEANYFWVFFLFLNPFSQVLWSLVAVIGLAGLTFKSKA